jgi:S-DNA-T family DNA segregation ATPase FtsK/SpoIIIE
VLLKDLHCHHHCLVKKKNSKKSGSSEKKIVLDTISLEIESHTQKEELFSKKEINEKVKEFGDYDPKLDISDYKYPKIDLLNQHDAGNNQTVDPLILEENKINIVKTLKNYKIEIDSIKVKTGPTFTLYEIVPAPGIRISKIKNLEDDIALSLAALGIRIIAPIPGKGTIGIEVPNPKPDIVSMHTAISSKAFQDAKMELPLALGKTITNETYTIDLAKMPHLLMAGATGQGKSVGLNAILVSLLYKKHPSQLKLVLVDPKKVELTLFNKVVRHFLAKLPDSEEAIITDTQKVVNTINSLCVEMDSRYELLKNASCRNILEYNAKFKKRKLNPEKGHKYLPYIVLVIDEFADLIMTAGTEIETPIVRLAQLAREIGVHLIIATQRPSVSIITNEIKANFPSRIAFRVSCKTDSRTILDAGGADQLIGRGDMLLSTGNELIRIQCAFTDKEEVEDICEFIGEQRGYPNAYHLPEYIVTKGKAGVGNETELDDRDALFEDAARVIVMHQQGSASLLQTKLKLGYNRAGRIVDQLEAAGIIGQFEGSKAREVLIPDEISLERKLVDLQMRNIN